ncbi:hypothetical protein GGI43DRAFT_301431 [Trichoderma evansii]
MDGSLAAGPALGVQQFYHIFVDVYFFLSFIVLCSKRLVEAKSSNVMINQLVCKLTATSMRHGKESLFPLKQLPQCCERTNFRGSRTGIFGAGDRFVEPVCPGVALRRATYATMTGCMEMGSYDILKCIAKCRCCRHSSSYLSCMKRQSTRVCLRQTGCGTGPSLRDQRRRSPIRMTQPLRRRMSGQLGPHPTKWVAAYFSLELA